MKGKRGESEMVQPARKLNYYPTNEQMETIFAAWTKDGARGIEEALRTMYPPTKPGTATKTRIIHRST